MSKKSDGYEPSTSDQDRKARGHPNGWFPPRTTGRESFPWTGGHGTGRDPGQSEQESPYREE